MPFRNDAVGGINLVRSAIQSPNFVAGSTGWIIRQDGSAEFHGITVTGGSLVISGAGQGVFVYSGTPALGNLIVSMASAAGSDAFGNSYPKGFGVSFGAIPGTLINAGTVGTTQIANNAITTALLAAAAVATGNIANGAVTTTQIAAAAGILGSQLSATANISGSQLAAAAGIVAGQVSFTARGIGGITTSVQSSAPAGAVTGDLWFDTSNSNLLNQFASGTWSPYTFGTNAITAGSITAALIAANTITASQIAAGTITATQIAAATITGSLIAAGTITGTNISAGTITGDLVAANAIVAGLIAAGAIDSMTLNAVTINGDTISAADVLVSGVNGGVFAYSSGGTIVKTISSTQSWVAPAGVTSVLAECWGGGGGGGGQNTGGTGGTGGGGGGGEYAAEATLAVTPGLTYTATVGAGGAAHAATPGNGTAGGNTTFPGDSVTVTANGGSGGINDGFSNGGGPGGTHSTNTTHHNGGGGGPGAINGSGGGGGGGSSGGTGSAGNIGNGANNAGGAGGAAVSGGGAGAQGASAFAAAPATGGSPGGGGGGAGRTAGGVGNVGSAGAKGQIRLTYTSTTPALVAAIAGAVGTDPVAGVAIGPGLNLMNTSAPAGVSGAALLYGATGQPAVVNAQGLALNLSGAKLGPTSSQAVSNTITETAIATLTVPANDVAAGAVYEVEAWGVYGTAATAGTLTWALRWGGVAGTQIVGGFAPTLPNSSSGIAWLAKARVVWYGTTEAVAYIWLNISQTGAATASIDYQRSSDTTGLTTTGSNDLVLTVKWGTASASNTVTRHGYKVGRGA